MDLVRIRKNEKWFLILKTRYTSTFVGVEVVPLFVVELLVVMPARPRNDRTVENDVCFVLFDVLSNYVIFVFAKVRQAYRAHYSYMQVHKSEPKSLEEPIN
jgi:hypothetical protein